MPVEALPAGLRGRRDQDVPIGAEPFHGVGGIAEDLGSDPGPWRLKGKARPCRAKYPGAGTRRVKVMIQHPMRGFAPFSFSIGRGGQVGGIPAEQVVEGVPAWSIFAV